MWGAHFSRAKSFPHVPGPQGRALPRKTPQSGWGGDAQPGKEGETAASPDCGSWSHLGKQSAPLVLEGGKGKSVALHAGALGSQNQELPRGRSRQRLKEVTAPATGSALHWARVRSAHPQPTSFCTWSGGLSHGAGGRRAAAPRDGHSRAEESLSEWDGQERGSCGSSSQRWGAVLPLGLLISQGWVGCPLPWGWLLTPQPHGPVLPPLSILLWVHVAAVAAA